MLRNLFFFKNSKTAERGNILLYIMVFGALSFTLIVLGIASYGIGENRASVQKQNREQALQIAEAGVTYYRWHLAHNPTDFTDGTNQVGPYLHDYTNKDGTVIGHFSLNITAPPTGSSIVVIQSTGWLDSQPNSKRTIKVKIGFPSLTQYAFMTNSNMWIGNNETMHGALHSNGGVRFDGISDAPVTSAVASYTCAPVFGSGCQNTIKPGVWGQGGPQSYWAFPVPAQDFNEVTAELAKIKTASQENGLYLSSSGQQGWRIKFNANATLTAYKVTATNCYKAQDVGSNTWIWPCVDIKTVDAGTIYPMPANNYIYVEDMVWVDGVVNGRATIGTAVGKSIIINGNIIYVAKDGNHALGLIAEQNILIPHDSPDTLEIDGVVLAQKGAAKRYYYAGDTKTSLTTYGAIISYGIWTWSWVTQGGAIVSGYKNTNSTYDANLTYGPPPGFPVGSQYNLLSWEEVK